jgi:hypothetical protein
MVLTVAWVPTGAKSGVGTLPCGVCNVPSRARLAGVGGVEIETNSHACDYSSIRQTSEVADSRLEHILLASEIGS